MSEHEKIVVGVDGSTDAALALLWALEESRRCGADVEIVVCWHAPYMAESSGYAMGYLTPEEMSAEGRGHLKGMLDAFDSEVRAAQDEGRHVTSRLLEGSPGPVLTTESKGALMLVVGRRGHGGLARAILGSVSHYVTSHATCPVVVIPEPS